jgi:aminoglycoside phosphotransferase (APT) family kinase protein
MAPQWAADVELDADLAARLIAERFPPLSSLGVEPFGSGWDNAAFLVGGEFVFRFPRRELGAALLRNELRALPFLAPRLPLPVPVPEFAGRPGNDYPYVFAGYRMLAGRTSCQVKWEPEARANNADRLGLFLSALHSIPISGEVAAWAPRDEIRRADIPYRAPILQRRIEELPALPAGLDRTALMGRIEALASSPPPSEPGRWVHGDLYARHLLVDRREELCGVIDWGDAHLGDRALDLSIVYTFLPPEARGKFWDRYGVVDAATRDRARFRALHYGAILMAYGSDVGDGDILRVGEDALRFAMIGD